MLTTIVGWIVWGLAAFIAATWSWAIRRSVKTGVGVTKQTITTTMLLVLAVLSVPVFDVSPFHLLWIFPAAWVVGILSQAIPLSLLWVPANVYGQLCCLGLSAPPTDDSESASDLRESGGDATNSQKRMDEKESWPGLFSRLRQSLTGLGELVYRAGATLKDSDSALLVIPADSLDQEGEERRRELLRSCLKGFFYCAAAGHAFVPVEEIESKLGKTLSDRYPGASQSFTKFATSYWTLKLLLETIPREDRARIISQLLRRVEMQAGAFFLSPCATLPLTTLEQVQRETIKLSGAPIDVEDFIRGNPLLSGPRDQTAETIMESRLQRLAPFVCDLVRARVASSPETFGMTPESVDAMPKSLLMGMPEATIAVIVETYSVLTSQGLPDEVIFRAIEQYRSSFAPGGTLPKPLTLTIYMRYRLAVEHAHGEPMDQFIDANIRKCLEFFSG